MRIKFLAAVAAVAVLFSACATAPTPKKFVCQDKPQWTTNDEKGTPSAAIYLCFREDGVLIYQSRALTADEIKAMTAAPAVQARDPKTGRFTKAKAKATK